MRPLIALTLGSVLLSTGCSLHLQVGPPVAYETRSVPAWHDAGDVHGTQLVLAPDTLYVSPDSTQRSVRVGPNLWQRISRPRPAPTPRLREWQSMLPDHTRTQSLGVWQIGQTLHVQLTAYASVPEQTDDTPFEMANGDRVHWRAIAHNGLPFGTMVKFPEVFGNEAFVVKDRMNKRYDHRYADVWMPNNRLAKHFRPRRDTPMEIIFLP